MKVIIIEDEKIASNLLQKMLLQIDPKIEIIDSCYDLLSGIASIKKHQPELVFLDVELPMYSGLQLLEFFKLEDIDFKIIFTTASNQHAVQAFEMSAIDYVLKPIQLEKLKRAIDRHISQKLINNTNNISILTQNLETPNFKKIVVPVLNGFEFFNIQDIVYLEAEGSYTKVYLKNKQFYTISKNLKYFDTLLKSNNIFIRIHRSYIANISMIKKLLSNDGYTVVFDNGTQLPVSNDKVKDIIKIVSG